MNALKNGAEQKWCGIFHQGTECIRKSDLCGLFLWGAPKQLL